MKLGPPSAAKSDIREALGESHHRKRTHWALLRMKWLEVTLHGRIVGAFFFPLLIREFESPAGLGKAETLTSLGG